MRHVAVLVLCLLSAAAFSPIAPQLLRRRRTLAATIVSPFDTNQGAAASSPDPDDFDDDDELPLVSRACLPLTHSHDKADGGERGAGA